MSNQYRSQSHRRRILSSSYRVKVLGYNPIAYWMFAETGGRVAACEVNSEQNGSYVRDVSAMGTGDGIGDGGTAPLFTPGQADSVDVFSAALAAAFDGAEGTALIWAKVRDVSVWTDSTIRFFMRLIAWSDYVYLRKPGAANLLQLLYHAGDTTNNKTAANSTIDWFSFGLSWSKSNDRVRLYLNGEQKGTDSTGLGNWTGALSTALISVASAGGWDGYLAHAMIFDYELGETDMSDLAVV